MEPINEIYEKINKLKINNINIINNKSILDNKKIEEDKKYEIIFNEYYKIELENKIFNEQYQDIIVESNEKLKNKLNEIKSIKKYIELSLEYDKKLNIEMNNNLMDINEKKRIRKMINYNKSNYDMYQKQLIQLTNSNIIISIRILMDEKRKMDDKIKFEHANLIEHKKKYQEYNDKYHEIKNEYCNILRNNKKLIKSMNESINNLNNNF